jgi:hypothetical protein
MTNYVLFMCGHIQLERDAKEGEVLDLPEVRRDFRCPRCELEVQRIVSRQTEIWYGFVDRARDAGAV